MIISQKDEENTIQLLEHALTALEVTKKVLNSYLKSVEDYDPDPTELILRGLGSRIPEL